MDVAIDANILFRTLISEGEIIELYFHPSLKIYAPERLWLEFQRHKEEIMEKGAFSRHEFDLISSILLARIELVSIHEYRTFIPKAKEVLKGHEKDEDFLALCLLKKCKLWTYEKRFYELGYVISTKEISKKLDA